MLTSPLPRIHAQADRFIDEHGRQVILRGVNLGGDSKVPWPHGGTQYPTDFADHREVSFINRPFALEEASVHFTRLRDWGFNCLRLLTTWEAVEHAGPGQYDQPYLDYFAEICRLASEHGFYVFIDFHQDVWSRMSGGDGAPGWTFDAVGLDFTRFDAAGAAHVMQNRYHYASEPNSSPAVQPSYPPMSWVRNYRMPANAIMWTLFWAGEHLTPQCRINGVNVQEYLQSHLLGAMTQVAQRVKGMPHVLGFDSMNEPGVGWLGQSLSPKWIDGARQLGNSALPGPVWSPLEALAVARGVPTELPVRLSFGAQSQAAASETVNPHAVPIWRPGHACPFEQAGIYALKDGQAVALREKAFSHIDGRPHSMADDAYGPFFRRAAQSLRAVSKHWMLFAEIDPLGALNGRTFPHNMPPQSVNTSHWYDLSLLVTKRFDPALAIDVLSGERSEGLSGIGARYQRQLAALKALSNTVPGGTPTLIGEFGIPYDLDDSAAFKASALRASQPDEHAAQQGDENIWATHTQALGLMYDALDALHLSGTQWNYTAGNRNDARIGDQWNQEDLSIYSLDQPAGRAVEGFCRPYARALQGQLVRMKFSAESNTFSLIYRADPDCSAPTEIFLPRGVFADVVHVEVSGPELRRELNLTSQTLRLWAASRGTMEVTCSRRTAPRV
jgi:Cellulase (glycosyl hydrolase family 5)/Glycoside hydrolase family 5 C-terminal domain